MKLALRISLCLLVVGCVSAEVRRLDQVVRPIRSPDSVTVFLERPQQPHTVIATIQGKGESVFDSFDDIRRRMIVDAAQIGGDALILGPESTKSTFLILPTALIKSDRKELTAEVIVFNRPSRRGG
jgi:hypothetical protein